MADVVLQAVIRKAVEIASNQVIQEASRFSRVKEDIDWIQSEMSLIQSYLKDADAREAAGDNLVATWVTQIRDLGLYVEDTLETYFPEIPSPEKKKKGLFGRLRSACGIFGYVSTAHKFAVEVEGIKTRVNEIHRRRLTYGIQEKSGSGEGAAGTWDARRSFPHVDEPNVVGFEEHVEKLKARMLDRNSLCGVISITGMAGLGKTTLAKKIYNSVQQNFECSAWICVSQRPNVPELLRDIARQVGLEKEKWEQNVETNLYSFLLQKRYVIAIDDLWQNEPWDYGFKNGIPNNSESGSRIILTSRNRDVGVHVGGQSSLYKLQPLDPENSRNLFFKMIGAPVISKKMKETGDTLPPELENISKQILKRCGGVPLAIVLTAGMLLLRERTEPAWKWVLESMGQEDDQCSKIFALSYKDLPTQLKPCFLYFGFFPEDYEIPAFDLINIWAAEGFIQPRRSGVRREVGEVGEDYLNHLVARNLIQVARRGFDGRIKSCRIHDILRSLSARVAKEIKFLNTHNDDDIATVNSFATRVRRLAIYGRGLREHFHLDSKSATLRAMLWFPQHVWEDDVNFIGGLRLIRVLCLEFEDVSISFPSEFGNLNCLIYIRLKVQSGRIKLPSTISNLTSLTTLDARQCYALLIIPEYIWKIKQLRRLLLFDRGVIEYVLGRVQLNAGESDHSIEAFCINVTTLNRRNFFWFPKFTNLRKLGIWFLKDDLSKVKVLLDAASTTTGPNNMLEILRLTTYDIGTKFNIGEFNLCRFENLSRLHFHIRMVKLPEHDEWPPYLTKLTLVNTFLEEDPMETLKKLPKLKILKLGDNSYWGRKMMVRYSGEVTNNFPQLQVLDIHGLYAFRELMVEEEVMPRLNKFRLTRCPGIKVMRIPNRIQNVM